MAESSAGSELDPADADRVAAYRRDGYAIFEGVYDEATMAAMREEIDRLEAVHRGVHEQPRSWWFGNMLERAPALMWPVVSNPLILDFAERIVGPFMQLDNLTLAAFPPLSRGEANGKVTGWHRDRWSHLPRGHYERPIAMNAICYLQDLDAEHGELRIVPGSHLNGTTVEEGAGQSPRVDEEIVPMKAGDVIFTHNGLLHSGSPNVSGRKRYFLSVYYNLTWLKHTDTFDGPNCRQLKAWARKRNDHR